MGTTIIVPCPQCGQRIRGAAERVNETAVGPCGHKFPWNANSLRNPIQPPRKDVEPWGWPVGLGSLLCVAAVYGFLLQRRSSSFEVPFALIAIGVGLFVLNAIRSRVGRSIAEQRYQHWAYSAEGHRYNEIQKDIQVATEAFARAEAAARAAEEEKGRRELALRASDRNYLLKLSPRDFEQHVADLFAALGYRVDLTPASHDEGIDAYLEKDRRRAVVQCKHLTDGAVSRPALQQFFGVLKDKGVAEGFFITTGRFTEQATKFAKGKPIHLIDLERLVDMARNGFTEEFIRLGPSGSIIRPGRRRRRRRWYRR